MSALLRITLLSALVLVAAHGFSSRGEAESTGGADAPSVRHDALAGAGSMMTDLARMTSGARSRRVSSYDRTGGNNDRFEGIADGETRTLFEVAGAGVINHLWITIAPPPPELSRHDLILRMYWDGETLPSVEAPVGDFFGQGWDEAYDFSSLPLAAGPRTGRGLVSYWAMPFSKGARITVTNDSGRAVDAFYYYVDYLEVDSISDDMGRFHAWYNHELTEALPGGENEWSQLGPQEANTTGDGNYLIADIEGRGHYVGVNYYVHSPSPMWYGEGDDMFFLDGEAWPPSLHGTGTEDYFNTSWSPDTLFSHPFYGYGRVDGETGWLGRTHVYRFHVTDPVHFEKSLRFSIEHGHDNNLTLDLSSVAYWYQTEPHKPFPPFPSREARAPRPFLGATDLHLQRHAWRESRGADPKLWGNERGPVAESATRASSQAASATAIEEPVVDAQGWKRLFNGRDLSGWKMVGPGSFNVVDGTLVTEGGMGLLWWEREKFGNCQVRVVFKLSKPTDNSGVYFRIDGRPAEPWFAVHRGYEAQISNNDSTAHRTGALYSFTNVKERVDAPAGEWTTMLITLEGPRTKIEVNGTLVTDYTEGDPVPEKRSANDPDRGRRPDFGYIGLQNHDEHATVTFREVSVRGL